MSRLLTPSFFKIWKVVCHPKNEIIFLCRIIISESGLGEKRSHLLPRVKWSVLIALSLLFILFTYCVPC